MRPRHVDAHSPPFGSLLYPSCGCQYALCRVFWRAHAHRPYAPFFRCERRFRFQTRIAVAKGGALPSKPERDALLSLCPEDMIFRSVPSTDLSVPLEKRRGPSLSLDHFEFGFGK